MAKNKTIIYAPRDTREIIKSVKNKSIENPLIRFSYFLDSYYDKDKINFKKADIKSKDISDLASYIRERKTNLACSLAKRYDVRGFQAEVSWRLVVGLGQEHVQETSMCLDHIYGVPYIPASAIKGVLRHYYIENELGEHFPKERLVILENILERFKEEDLKSSKEELSLKYKVIEKDENGDKKEILPLENTLNSLKKKSEFIKIGQKIFGTQDKKGEVIFLDAVIESLDRRSMAKDIMTPHYSNYYSDNKTPPKDSLFPVPISFLTMEKVKFNFYFLGKDDEILDKIWNGCNGWLAEALKEKGIGAKTSVGYGYFQNIKDITSDIVPNESEEQGQKQEIDLENMTETEKICYFLNKYKDAENPQEYENYSYDVYSQLDQVEGKDKIAIAKALKAYWQQIDRKWEGKLSKKQKSKVKKIKGILKEK